MGWLIHGIEPLGSRTDKKKLVQWSRLLRKIKLVTIINMV